MQAPLGERKRHAKIVALSPLLPEPTDRLRYRDVRRLAGMPTRLFIFPRHTGSSFAEPDYSGNCKSGVDHLTVTPGGLASDALASETRL